MSNDGLTPYEKLLGKPSSYEHIKTFRCLCYVKNSNSRAEKCVLVGYPKGQKGWTVYNLKTLEIYVLRDVVYYGDIFPYAPQENDSSEENPSPTFALDFCYVEEDITSSNDGQQDQIIISKEPREEQVVETNSDCDH
ncbi:unnamed protein product [Vicia faba]|uniref:Retroviral polymerase SH3-like domain-containing protein n=1 Tax=Vicia faba TaxID=3906 RepID=A0AAV0ZIM8_VICFA|nr:unnamed protein product [Vicia faba]